MLCNANPRKKKNKESKNNKEEWYIIKNTVMKHKDHVRKTQLDRTFCIQNFINATFALELLFILE